MSSTVCPHCKTLTTLTPITMDVPPAFLAQRYPSNKGYRYGAMRCSNNQCAMLTTVVVDGRHDVVAKWPERATGKEFLDVPEDIAVAANEAHMCLSFGAFRAAIAMARAVVEATAKAHGITTGLLHAKIAKMAETGVISEAMREAADEIRFAGNEVAHGDLASEPLGQEDAEEIVALMDAILLRVFQEPQQVARVRARRTARLGAES